MTDHIDALPEPSDEELADLTALLARADAWEDPPAALEDAVVNAIAAEARATGSPEQRLAAAPTSLDERRARRRWPASQVLGAAAAIALIVAGVVILGRSSDDSGIAFALAGTDAAPEATADVTVSATPAGLKIILDADGLDGAPEGYMYEAWIGDGEIGISCGSFHLRGGDGPIELWAGVADPSFTRLWVTLEPIDDDFSPSGDTRLRGEFSFDD